ncbi:MAG: hypothetical protein EOO05_11235 [Chitinophagaceae bacterium]|nr:MAG: hypothetical protein EOO05_11235 [Chitinophagaceae bacterium]
MKKTLTLLSFLCLMVTGLFAQTLGIENVQRATLRNSAAIREGSEVKGYYFFYVSDKIDKRTYEYTLRITDNNLATLKDVKFTDSKYVQVLESSFNGTDLIFLFYNEKERTFEYQTYGADGKKKFTYTRELSKKETKLLELTYLADEEDTYKGLYPVEGQGFISNMPSREDKDFTFQVDFFSTEKRKQWTYIPTEGAKKHVGDYLGTANGVVYMGVLEYGSKMDQKPDSYIIGLDMATGKKLFQNATDNGKYRYYPSSMNVVGGKAYIFGEYFDLNGNIIKDKSSGFAFLGIDEKGKIVSEKFNSWDLQLGKFLDVSSKGRIADFGYMYVHQIIQLADGDVYAIGEGWKKQASTLGIMSQVASAAAGGGGRGMAAAIKIKITDLIIIRFDKDFNVKGAQVYAKRDNPIELPQGVGLAAGPALAKMIKYNYGGFDYAYSQVNKDRTAFSVCYEDYVKDKENDYKGQTFNSISFEDGKFSQDMIRTKSKATSSVVMPAQQGKVLILEYFKKDKRLDAHFEKLN